jgi:hypothetical protein
MKNPIIPFILLISLYACANKPDTTRLIRIGTMLTKLDTLTHTSRFIPDVIAVGDGLFEKMTDIHHHASHYDFQITPGDLDYPYGNNKADYILTIISDYHNVAIRLKYNKPKDKYAILGYMTICKPHEPI